MLNTKKLFFGFVVTAANVIQFEYYLLCFFIFLHVYTPSLFAHSYSIANLGLEILTTFTPGNIYLPLHRCYFSPSYHLVSPIFIFQMYLDRAMN